MKVFFESAYKKAFGVPVKYAIAASKVIKNSKLHVMKGFKHWAQNERLHHINFYIKYCRKKIKM